MLLIRFLHINASIIFKKHTAKEKLFVDVLEESEVLVQFPKIELNFCVTWNVIKRNCQIYTPPKLFLKQIIKLYVTFI